MKITYTMARRLNWQPDFNTGGTYARLERLIFRIYPDVNNSPRWVLSVAHLLAVPQDSEILPHTAINETIYTGATERRLKNRAAKLAESYGLGAFI